VASKTACLTCYFAGFETRERERKKLNSVQMDVTCEACPLQIEGTAFYFRARDRHWTMGIGGEPG
jgi:hypothetical protein